MNERIKELADEAGLRFTQLMSNPMVPVVDGRETDLEKFAQLIVAECSKVIVNGGYWSGGPLGPKRQCTPPEIAQMIKEHFGVEE
jgi:hypothetical protein